MAGAAAEAARGVSLCQGSMHIADQQQGQQFASHRDSRLGARVAVRVELITRAYTRLSEAVGQVVWQGQQGWQGWHGR